jgi:maleate isomerase
MRDELARRLMIGVITPSTNTVVEPEYHDLAPGGVTVQTGRLLISRPELGSDQSFQALIRQVRQSLAPTVANLVTCKPDHLAMGMTALTFLGGKEGNERVREQLEDLSGLPVTTGPDAMVAALQRTAAGRIALLSPYEPHPEAETIRFFRDWGFDVVRHHALPSTRATAIAQYGAVAVRDALIDLDGDDIDAIGQVGTNLPMARLAAAAELWLGKPVLPVNSATVWWVLRRNGITDRTEGFGCLFRDH